LRSTLGLDRTAGHYYFISSHVCTTAAIAFYPAASVCAGSAVRPPAADRRPSLAHSVQCAPARQAVRIMHRCRCMSGIPLLNRSCRPQCWNEYMYPLLASKTILPRRAGISSDALCALDLCQTGSRSIRIICGQGECTVLLKVCRLLLSYTAHSWPKVFACIQPPFPISLLSPGVRLTSSLDS
jgi:hypothetical protein